MNLLRAIFLAGGLLFSAAAAETYTVKAGDTLYNVARTYQIDPTELMRLNGMNSSTLQLGQKLKVPAKGAGAAPAKAAPVAQSAAPARGSNGSRDGVVRAAAVRFLGIPYRLGGTGRGTIDCSAFTRAVLAQMGIDLPRTARAQFGAGSPVSRSDLRPGDLIFFNTLGNGVSHVGVYLGGGQFAHANSYYGRTMIEDLGMAYYRTRYVGARRVLPTT